MSWRAVGACVLVVGAAFGQDVDALEKARARETAWRALVEAADPAAAWDLLEAMDILIRDCENLGLDPVDVYAAT